MTRPRAGMINPSPVRRPTRKLAILWLHGIRLLLLSRPSGVSIFFRVFSSQEITTLRPHPPLLRMQRLLNSRFHSTIQGALVSPIVEKVSSRESCLDTRERKEALILILKGLQSPLKLGICSATSSATFLLHPRFRNSFHVRPARRHPDYVFCPQNPDARVRARSTVRY
jgi:hypothetical protein